MQGEPDQQIVLSAELGSPSLEKTSAPNGFHAFLPAIFCALLRMKA